MLVRKVFGEVIVFCYLGIIWMNDVELIFYLELIDVSYIYVVYFEIDSDEDMI